MRIGSPEFLTWLTTIPCDACGIRDLQLVWVPGMVVKPTGTYSLAGATPKVSAQEMLFPWLVCPACHRIYQSKPS